MLSVPKILTLFIPEILSHPAITFPSAFLPPANYTAEVKQRRTNTHHFFRRTERDFPEGQRTSGYRSWIPDVWTVDLWQGQAHNP
jgi:hypothetical protein